MSRLKGITQIVFGILALLFGIGTVAGFNNYYWVNRSGSGIWFGIWIIITGIIGVLSAKKPAEISLNGCNMGFNIVCTCVSFFVGIFFLVALV
ncbi:MAG: CD20-like domain-containing protein [Cyanobacteria bacterium J06649_11]